MGALSRIGDTLSRIYFLLWFLFLGLAMLIAGDLSLPRLALFLVFIIFFEAIVERAFPHFFLSNAVIGI